MNRLVAIFTLAFVMPLAAGEAPPAADAPAIAPAQPERKNVSQARNAQGIMTTISDFKMYTEEDGKRSRAQIFNVNRAMIMQCMATAEGTPVQDVVFHLVQGEKPLVSAVAKRLENTDIFEARLVTPDVPGLLDISIQVRTPVNTPVPQDEINPPPLGVATEPAKTAKPVKPPRLPDDF